MIRPYLRNRVPGWSLEAQEAKLREAGCWNDGAVYRDDLSAAKVRARDPADLKQRAVLLKPSSRRGAEVIAVATLPALAVSTPDLLDALAAAGARGATVRAADTGFEITPSPEAADYAGALREFQRAKRAGETTGARSKGVEAAAKARNDRTAAGCALIRDEWRNADSTVPTPNLIAASGLSRRTVESELGSRTSAQAEAQRTIKRREARQAKRATK